MESAGPDLDARRRFPPDPTTVAPSVSAVPAHWNNVLPHSGGLAATVRRVESFAVVPRWQTARVATGPFPPRHRSDRSVLPADSRLASAGAPYQLRAVHPANPTIAAAMPALWLEGAFLHLDPADRSATAAVCRTICASDDSCPRQARFPATQAAHLPQHAAAPAPSRRHLAACPLDSPPHPPLWPITAKYRPLGPNVGSNFWSRLTESARGGFQASSDTFNVLPIWQSCHWKSLMTLVPPI